MDSASARDKGCGVLLAQAQPGVMHPGAMQRGSRCPGDFGASSCWNLPTESAQLSLPQISSNNRSLPI